jgi:hypothetical protein
MVCERKFSPPKEPKLGVSNFTFWAGRVTVRDGSKFCALHFNGNFSYENEDSND